MRALTLLLALALAGCASPAAVTDDADEPQYNDGDRDLVVDQPTLPTAPPQPGERTLDAVPVWRLAEWWKVRLTSEFDGTVEEFYRVVAGTEHGNYLVGFPVDGFSNMAMVMHHPAFGDINRTDLSYDTHDQPFKHLQFPLREGDSWKTKWQTANSEVTVLVEQVDEEAGTARLSLSGSQSGTILYDASIGEAREMVFTGYGKVEVVDHGYNWTGPVRVPHAHDLVFYHGRLGGVLPVGQSSTGSLAGPVPMPVTMDETIEVDRFYDRVSFAIIMLDLAAFMGGTPTGAGYYQQTATAPDGTEYSLAMSPADQTGVKIAFFEHEVPGGTWSLNTVAAGPGQVLFEGIGYHSIDIDLPSGCVRQSGNALHHVTLCKAR